MAEHTSLPWEIERMTLCVISNNGPKGRMRVADMRGWGHLTGKGDGALGLSDNEAFEIQEANAAFIVTACNNHDQMVKTLEALRDDPSVPPWIRTLVTGSLVLVGIPNDA